MTIYDLGQWMILSVFVLVFAYVLVRGVSFAYFRSRYEHFRMLRRLRDANKEE